MEGREARFGAVSLALLADPLAFLQAEHARQRALLGHLERLARHAAGASNGAIARALAAWFACELPLHFADEEESILPRLPDAARAAFLPIAAQRAALRPAGIGLRGALARIAGGHGAPAGFSEAALAFVADYRRLIELEEAELFPSARRSLSGRACAAIAREMAARRALERMADGPNRPEP